MCRTCGKNSFAAALVAYVLSTGVASAAYIDNGNGTVTDSATKLTWMRCPLGQTWSGAECAGASSKYTWTEVASLKLTFAGRSDWRLPSHNELQSIVDRTKHHPAVDFTAFPDTPSVEFWSSTQRVSLGEGYPLYVNFGSGGTGNYTKATAIGVRLVSGDPMLTGGQLGDNKDGTATDARTGLMWRHCAVGSTAIGVSQTWGTYICSGSPIVFDWQSASTLTDTYAGFSDWRLPTVAELTSITNQAGYYSLDTATFSDTAPWALWAAAPDAADAANAWYLQTTQGYLLTTPKPTKFAALLVRKVTGPQKITVVEYYHAGFDHYFITASPDEIALLDGGAFGGAWKRTGEAFSAFAEADPALGGVCRFFSTAFAQRARISILPIQSSAARSRRIEIGNLNP